MSDDHSVDDSPAGPTPVSRRTALGALGAAVVFVSHGFSPHPAVREPIRLQAPRAGLVERRRA